VLAESGAGRRGVGLDGIGFIQQSPVVKLLQEIPDALDVFWVKGNVRILEADPVAHAASEFIPGLLVAHDGFPAGFIVVCDGDFCADVGACEVEFFFHAEFDRQALGVPSRTAQHIIALHGLVTAYQVF